MNKFALKATLLGAIALGLGFLPNRADAATLVDQSNDDFTPTLFQRIQLYSPIGQEFVPNLNSLDFVELFTKDFGRDKSLGADLFVNVRFDNILGSTIGTSNVTSLPNDFTGITQFSFPETVSLNPGQRYVLEVKAVNGSDNWAVGSSGGSQSTYPNGNQIITINGVAKSRPNNDLWFREGTESVPVPEPCTILGSATFLGIATFLKRKKRKCV